MNCEKYQELLSDLVDGLISDQDRRPIDQHLIECVACAEVRDDFVSIVGVCLEHRGQYDAVPNEHALWLRISNTIESEKAGQAGVNMPSGAGWWFRLMNRSWHLSFPQLAAAAAVLVLMVSLGTMFSLSQLSNRASVQTAGLIGLGSNAFSLEDRYR